MAGQSTTRVTWEDLQRFPEDGKRREIIDGVLLVTPSAFTRHQRVVGRIFVELDAVLRPAGGEAFIAPLDVVFDQLNVVEPDVLAVTAEKSPLPGDRHVYVVPDLAVEVSSRSTKGIDRLRKRALYERFGVREYWIVDLDDDVIEAYVLRDGQYDHPQRFGSGDIVTSPTITGFAVPIEELLPV